MSHNLFAHEEDDENYYGFRKNPQQEAALKHQQHEQGQFDYYRFLLWPQLQRKMQTGKPINSNDLIYSRIYGTPAQRNEIEAYWQSNKTTNSSVSNSVTAGLPISQPGDASELQADAVADAVVSGGDAAALLEASETTSSVSPQTQTGSPQTTTPEFDAQLQASKGSGQQLDESTRSNMEAKMGADLSGVKIHTDSNAQEMAAAVNAKAFTHGEDIYFGSGYSPGDTELLSHELAHTQQNQAGIHQKIKRDPDKKWPLTGLIYSGAKMYENSGSTTKLIFTADQDYDCNVWSYRSLQNKVWYYVTIPDKGNIYGWIEAAFVKMVAAKDLAEVNITSEFSLPNSVETIDEFNLSFFGDKFTAKTTYQISGNGKDEYISFNLYYQGSGFADAQPIKILIDLNSDSNKMLFNAHSGDFDADFSKKHNTGLFITNKNQSHHKQGEREKEYEKSLHSMWSENKADIVFIEQGFINNKKTNYALFRINKIQFRGRYANNLGLHVIIYDDISSGNYWSPAEKYTPSVLLLQPILLIHILQKMKLRLLLII
jgi:Domain of unknown function (DUF4157)